MDIRSFFPRASSAATAATAAPTTLSGYYNLKQHPAPPDDLLCHLLQFDGAARGNPGPAAAAAVLFSPGLTRQPLLEVGKAIPHATNNVAEYKGLILGLRAAATTIPGVSAILIEGDSQLVIQQVIGKWAVKDPSMKILNTEVKHALQPFTYVGIKHVRREFNTYADALTNKVVKTGQDLNNRLF